MLDLPSVIRAHLQSRSARKVQLLVRIAARDRNAGTIHPIAFWTGADHEEFTADGQTETYFGAGTLRQMDPLIIEAGLNVRLQRLTFSKVAPEVELATRGYDTNHAAVKVFAAYFDPETHERIGAPVRRFKGKVAGLKFTREARPAGKKSTGSAEMMLTVRSSANELTRTLALKKSDEALQARAPGDRFRRYTDISGSVEAVWGDIRSTGPDGAGPSKSKVGPLNENSDR